MKMKKFITALLLVAVFCTLFAGCGEKAEVSSVSEVKLKWILGGPGKQADSDEVWESFNQKLQSKLPNTKVEFVVIATPDYAEKWKLIAASGEKVDIAWAGWMLNFEEQVRRGSFLPISELLQKYAPKLSQSIPNWVWETMEFDGERYGIPNYQMMVSRKCAIRTPEELANGFLDKEKIQKAFDNWMSGETSALTDECFDAIEDYCAKLKEAGKLGLGISPDSFDWLGGVNAQTLGTYGYVTKENDKVVIKNVNDKLLNLYKRIQQLYSKGYIRRDVLTIQDYNKDKGKKDGYVMWIHNYDDYTKSAEEIQYGMPIHYITYGNVTRYYKPGGTNTVLARTSENPERAMQLLEIINDENDKELYNLLVYGIEGKHYTKTGEKTIKTLNYVGTPKLDSAYGISKWIIGNTFNAYDTQSDIPGYGDYVKGELNAKADESILAGFKFDSTPIATELAQIASVENEFKGLKWGVYQDDENRFNQKVAKLKQCGIDKVFSEVQRQLDEWQSKRR